MTIGEKIKYLRQKNDVTQEKLAEYLGITYQSISKWENGNGMPDISLVVPLANFFGVSLDELFDRDSDMQAAEIEEYMKKAGELANRGLVAEELALWREAVQKYPRDYSCLNMLAHALYGTVNHSEEFDHVQDQNAKEAVDICERILRDCTDNGVRESAIQILVLIYSTDNLAIADEEKAVEYANMAGSFICSREILLTHAYYTEERKKDAVGQEHRNALRFMDVICTNMMYHPYPTTGEWKMALEAALKLWSTLIYDGNYLFYHGRISRLHFHLAQACAILGLRDDVISNLKEALYHARMFDNQEPGEHHYTSIFVCEATYDRSNSSKNYTETHEELIRSGMNHNTFDFIRDDPEFVALME
ncbi:MAG: helix-turn-helix transcriptional regulator [Clostridia bacterium]|nr:helix-turn-helix transcriptional regulator [Clostridia bacterium]